jgi:hypothetical protein
MEPRPKVRASLPRRVLGATVASIGMGMLLLTAAALWNPWRLVTLFPLADPTPAIIGVLLAGALIVAAGFLGLRGRARYVLAGVVVPVTVTAALVPGLMLWWLDDTFGPDRDGRGVVAVSPDGRFELVAFDTNTYAIEQYIHKVRLVARSRDGLWSRQGAEPVAVCSRLSSADAGAVQFIAPTTVAIATDEGQTVVVQFDPDTLAANTPGARC